MEKSKKKRNQPRKNWQVSREKGAKRGTGKWKIIDTTKSEDSAEYKERIRLQKTQLVTRNGNYIRNKLRNR